MSTVKRHFEDNEARKDAIRSMAEEHGALVVDQETQQLTSAEDEHAEMCVYAAAFAAWRDGRLEGSATEIFEAVQQTLAEV